MKKNNQSTYNYQRIIDSTKRDGKCMTFSNFIEEKIKECREKNYDGEVRKFNRSILAEMIGIDKSSLTKIINGGQATRKRDIIISLCFALQMTEADTNLALSMYQMATLNPYSTRDLVIIHALRDGASVENIDTILIAHNQHKLNTTRKKGKKERFYYYPEKSTPFYELYVNVQPYILCEEDIKLSLCNRYRPDCYDFIGEMRIQHKDNPSLTYRIIRDDSDQYEISLQHGNEWEALYTNDDIVINNEGMIRCNDTDLNNEVDILKEYIDCKAKYIHSMCNDSRYFKSRFSAKNEGRKLIVFGEAFGFDAPECCEYYQIEVSSSSCTFTISENSRFLENYLDSKTWKKLYGGTISTVKHSFESLEEIKPSQALEKRTAARWRSEFENLLNSARDLLIQIQKKEIYLFNARAFLDIDELMRKFNVVDDFDCIQPEGLLYEIVPQKASILGSDGKPITVDDLYRAAELEIFTLEDLCSIRSRYGSLEAFLQIDILSEQKEENNA